MIQRDMYIAQYVGTVTRKDNANAKSKYRMEMKVADRDYIIDAEYKGNWTRFINHSCDPNCVDRMLTVNGRQEVWIVSLKEIPEGTPLTIDYCWNKKQFQDQQCLCEQCQGK